MSYLRKASLGPRLETRPVRQLHYHLAQASMGWTTTTRRRGEASWTGSWGSTGSTWPSCTPPSRAGSWPGTASSSHLLIDSRILIYIKSLTLDLFNFEPSVISPEVHFHLFLRKMPIKPPWLESMKGHALAEKARTDFSYVPGHLGKF